MDAHLFLSHKFRFWSFASMLLLVFVHGYNLHDNYLQSTTMPGEKFTLTAFTEYLLSNGLLRFRIPMLFAISGYLFAQSDTKPYGQRALQRLRTLGLPYVLWTLIAVATIYFIPFIGPDWALAVKNTYLSPFQYDEFYTAQWWEYLMYFIFSSPVAFQLWFLRALLVVNLAYPALKWMLLTEKMGRHQVGSATRVTLFGLLTVAWILQIEFPIFYPEAFLFFSVGVWYAKRVGGIPTTAPFQIPAWVWGLVCLALCVGKTLVAFLGDPSQQIMRSLMHFPHKLAIVTGLVYAWYGGDAIVRLCMRNKAFVWASAFSFFIYALHEPLLHVLNQWVYLWAKEYTYYRIAAYFGLCFGIVALCILVGWLFRTLLPPVYKVLTGDRGMTTPPVLVV